MDDPRERVSDAIARAQDELEEALAELERLPPLDPDKVAFAAHALSNYLTITGGTVELLRGRLSAEADPQVMRWLDGLLQATGMMTHTVSQLMNSSAGSSMTLRFESVDLSVLAARLCDFYRRVAEPKHIALLYESEADVPEVWADRVALAAVMDNLLTNAIKYSPHGGRVLVSVKKDGASAVCAVQDAGPGVRESEREQLFRRGSRSEERMGGAAAGGYGLAVARELVGRLGGEIWCEDAPGTGAVFSIRVPMHDEDAPSAW